MKDAVDLVLGEHPVEELRVEDRADVVLADAAREVRGQRGQVEGDDGAVRVGRQGFDQPVADLAAGPGDKDDRLA